MAEDADIKNTEVLYKLFGGWEILDLHVELQANRADHICVKNCMDEDFLQAQISSRDRIFYLWNSTSVGNTAHLALYVHPKYRTYYKEMLEEILEWEKNHPKRWNVNICNVS